MTPKRRKSRIYWRGGRAWGDFRDYADVGGGREPLVPEGQKLATTEPDTAQGLAVARLTELKATRRRREERGVPDAPRLALFARDHLIAKKKAGKVTDGWLAATEGFLRRAVEFFGSDRHLDTIRPSDVRQYAEWLATLPARTDREGRPAGNRRMTTHTVRAHLFALSNLYRRAIEGEAVPVGYNPVAALMEKPSISRKEARWLEVHQGALVLESARTVPRVVTAAGESLGPDLAYPLIATFLLTGGRAGEVLGLELDDVSFDRQTITFRPNEWRRLKTRTSWRVVPLFPQLADVLRSYVFGPRLERGGRLLFPSFRAGQESRLVDVRKLIDRIAMRAGWKRGEIRCRIFRHTYTAARLQTLDHGAPISLYTVSRELGHGSEDMVRRVYSHLGTFRHRSEVVEYRVEQHFERLGNQLIRLGFDTNIGTNPQAGLGTESPAPTEVEAGEDLPEWARRDSNARPLAPEASALSN
jgi:integrase